MSRDYIQKVRLSGEEHELLIEKADRSSMSVAAYMRETSKKKDVTDGVKEDVKKLVNEVNYIGNNINQITKNANAGIYTEDDKNRLMAYMKALNMKVKSVVDKYGD